MSKLKEHLPDQNVLAYGSCITDRSHEGSLVDIQDWAKIPDDFRKEIKKKSVEIIY